MKIVGITGGIGSGKTTVAKIFESYGIPVYYADDEAKKLNDTSPIIKKGLIDLFGETIYVSEKLDRALLASKIFSDKELLKKVNELVHPQVAKHFKEWVSVQDSPYVLKEAAILFESGSDKHCDQVILVTAPENVRIERVMKRDKIEKEQVLARMKNQWDDKKKRKLSNFVIENLDLKNTEEQVARIHKILSE